MGKVVKFAALVVGGVALLATGVGALGIGAISAIGSTAAGSAALGALGSVVGIAGLGGLQLAAVGLSLASSLLNKPAIGDVSGIGQFSSSPISFTGDINAGIPYVVGRTGFAGRIVKTGSSGYVHADDPDNDKPNYLLHYQIALSLGPIHAIEKFTATDVRVSFDSDGSSSTTPATDYDSFMWMRTQLGGAPYTAMLQPPGSLDNEGTYPGWTSAHKFSSMAAAWWILAAENPPYESGTPNPMWVLQGVAAYDPRLDSTQTAIGGSGPQRINDETTWAYTENPHLHALTFALGRYRAGKRMIGVGAPASSLDIAAYAYAANVADANGWKVGGVIFSTDSKWDALRAMHQAGGGAPLQLRAGLSCTVSAPRVSIETITGSDLSGAPQIAKTRTRRERINQVIPSYRSEVHGWQLVPAEPIRVDAYVAADRGELRSREIAYPMVQAAAGAAPNQAAQLARYEIEDSREIGPVVLPLRPYLMGLKPGDCITVDDEDLQLIDQDLVILTRGLDPQTGAPTLTCIGETFAKHAAALAQTGVAPPVPEDT